MEEYNTEYVPPPHCKVAAHCFAYVQLQLGCLRFDGKWPVVITDALAKCAAVALRLMPFRLVGP